MLEESINSSEEPIITYFQQLVGDYPLVLALIVVILLIVFVLVILSWFDSSKVRSAFFRPI